MRLLRDVKVKGWEQIELIVIRTAALAILVLTLLKLLVSRFG